MDAIRRSVLKAAGVAGALAGGLLGSWSALAAAWNKDAFAAKTPADAQKAVGGSGAAESRDIVIEAPQIAENGAVVPIEVMSNLPGTTSIAVLVDKNPFPLVGQFEFMAGAVPFVKLNVKMGETSDVRVLVSAGGKNYVAVKEVKVTIGGCGG